MVGMSEHRCILKIEFSIYGMKFEWDTSINYCPNAEYVDQRITDWFAECYAKARAEYDAANAAADELRRRTGVEQRERAELARLKAKYEPLATIPVLDQDFDWAASTQTYEGEGWGRMNLPDGEHGVRWHDPTPAGDFTVAGIVCKVCGHKVAMKSGDVIKRGDPRLCEHLGGPVPDSSKRGHGFGMKAVESTPGEVNPYKPENEISDRFEPR
jgi:hypothetical protein